MRWYGDVRERWDKKVSSVGEENEPKDCLDHGGKLGYSSDDGSMIDRIKWNLRERVWFMSTRK